MTAPHNGAATNVVAPDPVETSILAIGMLIVFDEPILMAGAYGISGTNLLKIMLGVDFLIQFGIYYLSFNKLSSQGILTLFIDKLAFDKFCF